MNISFCQTGNLHSGNPITETQLATLIDDWTKLLDNQGQFDDILDFEKKGSGYRYGTVPLACRLKIRFRIFSHCQKKNFESPSYEFLKSKSLR